MNDLAVTTPRLPVPEGINPDEWTVLTEAIFPMAQTTRAVLLALKYCKVRGLDPFKRCVNIVPVWNSALGKNIEQIWPSITEVEITASRSKEWAGMDEPKFGPMITETFEGRRKDRKKGWIDWKVEVTYPEFCSVTVYRMVNGTRCPFVEPVWWKEAYGRLGGQSLPNDMWTKRPRGQLLKVAKAFSLRAAFPEDAGEPTAEEMEGQIIDTAPPPPPATPPDNWQPPSQAQPPAQDEPPDDDTPPDDDFRTPQQEAKPKSDRINPRTGEVLQEPHDIEHDSTEPWRDWCARLMLFVRAEGDLDGIEKWVTANKKTIEAIAKDAPKIHSQLSAAIGKHRIDVTQDEGDDRPER